MIDRYSKIVLTVIASALVAIAFQQAIPKAHALGDGCGAAPQEPCYIEAAGQHGLEVYSVLALPVRVENLR